MRHQEIIFGLTGQSFNYYPPELGQPSSATVQVFAGFDDDTANAQAATTGSVTVSSVNTTLSSAVSAGTARVVVASATGIVRHTSYLLTDPSGLCERIEVLGISGTTAILRQPLVNDYASGATLQGSKLSISVNATWVANANNLSDVLASTAIYNDIRTRATDTTAPTAAGYRLRWSYTADGAATIGVSYADLVRYQAKNLVTPLDVDRLFPGWIDRLPPDYRADQGLDLINEAFSAIRLDALSDAQLVRRIRDTQVLSDLVKYRANVLSMQNDVMSGRRDTAAYQLALQLYEQRYTSLIREPKVAVDQTGNGANADAVRLPVTRR